MNKKFVYQVGNIIKVIILVWKYLLSKSLRSPNRMFMWPWRNWLSILLPPINLPFVLSLGMNIQTNNMAPATARDLIWHPITNKLYNLKCWYSFMYCKRKSCPPLVDFNFLSQGRNYNCPLVQCCRCSVWHSVLTLNITYITIVL